MYNGSDNGCPETALIHADADRSQRLIHSGRVASVRKPPSRESKHHGKASGLYGDSVGVYIYHWAFMAAFALCCMHVQVATRYDAVRFVVRACLSHMACHECLKPRYACRFLLGAPPLFWFAAHITQRGSAQLVWTWCLGYAALGCLLFTNFYPWT